MAPQGTSRCAVSYWLHCRSKEHGIDGRGQFLADRVRQLVDEYFRLMPADAAHIEEQGAYMRPVIETQCLKWVREQYRDRYTVGVMGWLSWPLVRSAVTVLVSLLLDLYFDEPSYLP